MARVTVEDCITQVTNRFELVMIAASRSRALSSGASLTVGRDRDKNPVVALREIAEQKIDLDTVRETMVKNLQKYADPDIIDESPITQQEEDSAWSAISERDAASVNEADDGNEDSEIPDEEYGASGQDFAFEDADDIKE